MLVIVAKEFLMFLKLKESITSHKLVYPDFWQIAISVLNKGKSAVLLLFSGPEVLCSESGKEKLFAEIFSQNSNLDNSGISLPFSLFRTILKIYNIPVAPRLVKKVSIIDLDSSNVSCPNFIPVVVLKN